MLLMYITVSVTHCLTMTRCDLAKKGLSQSKSLLNHSLVSNTGTRSKCALCDFSPAGSGGKAQAERAAEDPKAAGRGFTHVIFLTQMYNEHLRHDPHNPLFCACCVEIHPPKKKTVLFSRYHVIFTLY